MRVRYVSGPTVGPVDPRLSIGQEYLVLGLSFEFAPGTFVSRLSVHLLLENGAVAEGDLAQFEITNPRTSRFWRIRTGQFDGRQFVDLLPPELFAILTIDDRDNCTSEEQDVAGLEALGSAEFQRVCAVLENEQDS
jgi:hypothetical protein